MEQLVNKKCQPCEGGVPPLTKEETEKLLPQVPDWRILSNTNLSYAIAYERLVREFEFKDFAEALAFINKIGALAEEEGHHPDILLHGYRHVRIELTTHAIAGLSENDFILAAKIDKINSRL